MEMTRMKDIFEIEWVKEEDEEFYENLILIPKKSVEIKVLGYRLIQETRGKLRKSAKTLLTNILLKNDKLIANNKNIYSIKIQNGDYETYNGINASVLYKIEIFLELDKESARELNLKFDLGKIFKSKTKLIETRYVIFKPNSKAYLTDDSEIELHLKNRISIISFLGFGIIIVYAISRYQSFSDLESFISVTILGGLVVLYVIYLEVIKRNFGCIKVGIDNVEKNKEYFRVKVTNEKEWKNVRRILIRYSLIEETVDERGTNTSRYKKELYRSRSNEVLNPINPIEAEFQFPEEAYRSREIGDVKIYWLLELSLKPKFGPSFKYESEFKIR